MCENLNGSTTTSNTITVLCHSSYWLYKSSSQLQIIMTTKGAIRGVAPPIFLGSGVTLEFFYFELTGKNLF